MAEAPTIMHVLLAMQEFSDRALSIPDEIRRLRGTPAGHAILESARGYGSHTNQELFLRISTSENRVVLWACHAILTQRRVPPCLRPPCPAMRALTFVTWLADVHWLAVTRPDHKPAFDSWDCLFRDLRLGGRVWHERAAWKYGRGKHPSYFCVGLGVDEKQQRELTYICRGSVRRERLSPAQWADYRERLLGHARRYPDRLQRRSPEQMADRRILLLDLFMKAGKSPGRTVEYLFHLTGESMTRQALMKQIAAIRSVSRIRV